MTDGTIGIKLKNGVFSAELARCVKRYRYIAISDVKNLVENDEYLLECSDIDDDGIEQILLLNEDLKKMGFDTVLFEDDEEISEELLNNRVRSMEIIAQQTEIDIDREAEEF